MTGTWYSRPGQNTNLSIAKDIYNIFSLSKLRITNSIKVFMCTLSHFTLHIFWFGFKTCHKCKEKNMKTKNVLSSNILLTNLYCRVWDYRDERVQVREEGFQAEPERYPAVPRPRGPPLNHQTSPGNQ